MNGAVFFGFGREDQEGMCGTMVHERWNGILAQLNEKGFVKVSELTRTFGVSVETIRRDMEALEQRGMLKRVYGGAIRITSKNAEVDYTSREHINIEEKQAIGRKAAELINNGDTIVVDPGTTTIEVVKALRDKKDLTSLTNSIPISLELLKNNSGPVFLLGGQLRDGYYSTSGFLTTGQLQQFSADKAIVGAGGISVRTGLTDYHVEEAGARKEMIRIADKVILVADSSKLGFSTFIHVCPLDDIDVLVTDWRATPEMLEPFRDTRMKIIIAEQS